MSVQAQKGVEVFYLGLTVDMDLLWDIPEATFAFFPPAGGAGVVRLREPGFSFMVAL